MYNGIGLTTPRGSGTNGYVQKNLAFITTYKEKNNKKTCEDIQRCDEILFKEPNVEILLHEKKRKIEVKCFELEQMMEEQGYAENEINNKVSCLRKKLLAEMDSDVAPKRFIDSIQHHTSLTADSNRLIPKGTHEVAAVNIIKNNIMKNALGISSDYEDGSSMHQSLHRKQAEENKTLFESQKRLSTLKSDHSDSSDNDSEVKKTKKKHKKRKHASISKSENSEDTEKQRKSKRKSHSKKH